MNRIGRVHESFAICSRPRDRQSAAFDFVKAPRVASLDRRLDRAAAVDDGEPRRRRSDVVMRK
jgi:hypothetical protein